MESVSFRSAELNDLTILYSFEQGIVTAERPYDPTLKAGPINYYNLKELIESDQSEVIVATLNKEIIASAYVKIKRAKPYLNFDEYAYVGFMYVKPTQRGKGISQKVIERLSLWAKSRNLNELRLEVYDENNSAIRAYEKSGLKKHMVEMRMKI